MGQSRRSLTRRARVVFPLPDTPMNTTWRGWASAIPSVLFQGVRVRARAVVLRYLPAGVLAARRRSFEVFDELINREVLTVEQASTVPGPAEHVGGNGAGKNLEGDDEQEGRRHRELVEDES